MALRKPWRVKAGVQGVLSRVPAGERLNFMLQSRLTQSFPRSDEAFRHHADEAFAHHRYRAEYLDLPVGRVRCYEFGAGWDLIGPIMFAGLGLRDQTVVDIRDNLRLDQASHTLEQYARLRSSLESEHGLTLRTLDPTPVASKVDLERRLGIRYMAPLDARRSGLGTESVDYSCSTFTLEHIPESDIAAILRDLFGLLRPGGVVTAAIDMEDHYSYFDPDLSPYNFLRYSERRWRLLNPSLHFQNRLRRCDYRRLFHEAGFELLEEVLNGPSPHDLELLSRIDLDRRFRDRDPEDVAVRSMRLVARKPRPAR